MEQEKERKLNFREKVVVAHYMQGVNQKESLIRAGYSKHLANQSTVFFSKPHIRAEIARRQKAIMDKQELTQEWIVEKLMLIAGANPGELIEIDDEGNRTINWKKFGPRLQFLVQDFEEEVYTEGRGPQARKVKRIKVKNADRLRAVDMLCKILGLYVENKVEVNIEQGLIERLQAGRQRVGQENAAA